MKYDTKMYIHVFQPSETIRSLDESIYIQKASIVEAEKDQSNPIY